MPDAPLAEKPVTGKNWPNGYDGVPCTCPDSCDYACKGECGCKACHDAYQDFLSDE